MGCNPHRFRISPMTGQAYCTGCHRHPHTISVDELSARLDAMATMLAHVGTADVRPDIAAEGSDS